MMVITTTATKTTTAMNEEQCERSIANNAPRVMKIYIILKFKSVRKFFFESSNEINRMESTPVIHALQNQNLQLM